MPAGTWIRKTKFKLFFDCGGLPPPPDPPFKSAWRPPLGDWLCWLAGWLPGCLAGWLAGAKKGVHTAWTFFCTRIKSSCKFSFWCEGPRQCTRIKISWKCWFSYTVKPHSEAPKPLPTMKSWHYDAAELKFPGNYDSRTWSKTLCTRMKWTPPSQITQNPILKFYKSVTPLLSQ